MGHPWGTWGPYLLNRNLGPHNFCVSYMTLYLFWRIAKNFGWSRLLSPYRCIATVLDGLTTSGSYLEDIFDAVFFEPEWLCLDDWAVDDVQTNGVGTILVYHQQRIRIILLFLGHLLAVSGQDQAVDNEVLEGRFVEQCGWEHQEGVEPSTGLRNHRSVARCGFSMPFS